LFLLFSGLFLACFYPDNAQTRHRVFRLPVCPCRINPLTLPLLMIGVLAANDHDLAVTLDDLAFVAHGLDRCSDFHVCRSSDFARRVPEKRGGRA
jgi:hypothetical protein